MKKILATLVTAAVIGAGGVAVASATGSPASAPTTASTSKPVGSTVRTTVGSKLRKLAFATAAKTIGISPADLLKDMKGGHSIAAGRAASLKSRLPQFAQRFVDHVRSTADTTSAAA